MACQQPLSLFQAVHQVRQGVGLADLLSYGLCRLSGPDVASFLHSQTTSDVLALQPGQGQASALLDRKANLQAYFSIHRVDEVYWILAEQTQIPHLLARLEQYHFSEDLQMTDESSRFAILTLQGPISGTLLQHMGLQETVIPAAENAISSVETFLGASAFVIRKTLTGEQGYMLAIPPERQAAVIQTLQEQGKAFDMVDMAEPVLEALRIEAGIPRYGVDMDADTMLPETGLEQVAVSYTKGCYPGQEVVAKVKTYGSVPRLLVGLIFQPGDALPPLNSVCYADDKIVGTLKSSVNSPTLQAPIALAYLSREYRTPHKVLDLRINDRVYQAKVVLLPFYTPIQSGEKARLFYDEALKRFAEDQEEEAIHLLREAIALDPHFADAYESLGVILSRRDAYDEAIALMQKLADIDPDAIMAHTNLSVFYMKKGMKAEAEEEKAKATTLSFKKALGSAQQAQSQAEEERRRQQALAEKKAMFLEVLALDAEDPLAHYGLGNLYVDMGCFEEALPHLEKAVSLDPKYTVAYLALGKAYQGAEQLDAARRTFEKGIEVASQRGDLMPLNDMQSRLTAIKTS